MPDASYDCLVVGGGPAGLTAAIYLARFHRRVLVVDKEEGRLAMIPRAANHAGYPHGIVGGDLLQRMRDQARSYGAVLERGEVTALRRRNDGLHADWTPALGPDDEVRSPQGVSARTVLLATGVVNLRPPVDEADHDDAVSDGLLRYCPICDAYEQTGRRIGVLGADRHGLAEALFLRTYSEDITLLSLTQTDLSPGDRERAALAGIRIVERPVSGFTFDNGVRVRLDDGSEVRLDTLYSALGSRTRNELGVMLGTELCDGECFLTDDRQRTNVAGVYAAGDAVEGLDQISRAMGTGAQAAVTIHNDLRRADGLVLEE